MRPLPDLAIRLAQRSVETDKFIGRFDRDLTSYQLSSIHGVDWTVHPDWLKHLFVPRYPEDQFKELSADLTSEALGLLMNFCVRHRAENELFWSFSVAVHSRLFSSIAVEPWIEKHPPLVYVLLKEHPPPENMALPEQLSPVRDAIVRAMLRSANVLGMATLVGLEKISHSINDMYIDRYVDSLMLAALSIRSKTLFQETLLVLHECRSASRESDAASAYLHKHALAVAFDCAEEAADACPCDDAGKPRKTHTSYPVQRVIPHGEHGGAKIHLRVDLNIPVRLHSHIRLQCVSDPANGWVEPVVLDGVVAKATRGELTVELFHPLPPEATVMQWNIYEAGSIGLSTLFRACARM